MASRAPASPAGVVPDASSTALLNHVFDEFFTARKPKKESPHTARGYQTDLRLVTGLVAGDLEVRVEDLRLGHLSTTVLRRAFGAYADAHSAASTRRAWSTWNQLFAFLVAEEIVPGNPMGAVGKPKVPPRAPKPLAGEDTPEILLASVAAGSRRARKPWPERDLALIATDLLTGLRLSELLALNIGSIDGRPGERRLKVTGKGRKERFAPIETPLEAVLDRYLETRRQRWPKERVGPASPLFLGNTGERLRDSNARYLVDACFRAAGIGACVPKGALVHALRHTFATRLAEDGASATEIQHLLGHEDLKTSQGYIDATAQEQRAAARSNRTYRALEGLVPPGPDGR